MLIVLAILIYLSSFFSSAETALTTVNKIKIRKLAEENNKKAQIVLRLIEQPSKMLIQIFNQNSSL